MKPQKGRKTRKIGKAFIEQNFNDEEWSSFSSSTGLSSEKSDEMQQYILQQVTSLEDQKQRGQFKLMQFARYLSAASVILVIAAGLYFSQPGQQREQKAVKVAQTSPRRNTVLAAVWTEIHNHKTINRLYQLPDHSMVNLYPGASIKFEGRFDQRFRDIYLQGKAKFKVSHNKARPFSVFSGALKTTALGTSFTIDTRRKQISVKLHTGRIVIANQHTNKTLAYISGPGNTLVYTIASDKSSIIKADLLKPALTAFMKREGSVIRMKNIPLTKVFNLLNEAYGVKVNMEKQLISTITFTGNIDTSKEQPEDILNLICLINNMTLSRQSAQEFTIQKSNQTN